MKTVSYYVSFVFAVLALSFLLPFSYKYFFVEQLEKTHVFHSVVLDSFVYTESVPHGMHTQKTEDHHDSIVYRDEKGTYFTRLEFEDALPFIYYRNAEVRGKLPFCYAGTAYGRKEIERSRRVVELRSADLYDKNFQERVYPLFEAKIQQAALTFPDSRLRFTDTGAEFVSADTNRVLEEKSRLFTRALAEKGVCFPVVLTAGNYTTFKPFEFGMFLVDSKNNVFWLRQYEGRPQVENVPFFADKKLRHIVVSENRSSAYLGLAVDWDSGVYLVKHSPPAFIPLPVPEYNADTMDLKLLFDPAELTAVCSDDRMVYAHTYTADFALNKSFSKEMARAWPTLPKKIHAMLFPVVVELEREHSGMIYPELKINGVGSGFSFVALGFGVFLCLLYALVRKMKKARIAKECFCFILLFGLPGFVVSLFLSAEA